MASEAPARWLLIGNSRWHWGWPGPDGLAMRHSAPPAAGAAGLGLAKAPAAEPWEGLLAWAAVGPVPEGLALPRRRRCELAAVPLTGAPPWLGIDRALTGWQAWRLCGAPVLVADAGTVLSLTRVDRAGAFAGGRLLAGAALQWRAMAAGTTALPALGPGASGAPLETLPPEPEPEERELAEPETWPEATADAMTSGVRLGLAAAVAEALADAVALEPACQLLLTGGDGPALVAPLRRSLERQGLGGRLLWRPALALEALAALAPAQASPRSARI